ncbi:MAG: EAL domain-containing protein, partial [Candidatus Thiodiazotropha sp. (ex Gloverina cf. vestifex)]|nr:EAL domain-containing protein [Candidatus Thiodiazotropha sp. (ex Gloverina cf. vestifex)]
QSQLRPYNRAYAYRGLIASAFSLPWRSADEIPYKKDDMEITTTIISMAKNLGLSVLAEGVETVDQHYFLQQQGCDFYQGYLFSPPVCVDDFECLLER